MKTLVILSQVYVPDPASVGQHLADAAAELAARGNRVRVYTSNRGYDNPRDRYPARELLNGVEVRRLPLSSFGKSSIFTRLLGGTFFLVQAIVRTLFMRRLDGLLVSTSPPICGLAALVIAALRRVPIVYWAMDINPDQAVAMGKVKPGALSARLFEAMNRRLLRRAACVVALDRFMADRLRRKAELGDRLVVLPPWPHDEPQAPLAHADNPFRAEHGLQDKFVIMYSGNMSPAHPLTTVLDAALRLQDDPRLLFLFIGGGQGKAEVQRVIEQHRPANIRLLPYQPLDRLRYSLSAADVHLVSMGTDMVGIVHPCKIYGAMACARPILVLGPARCHLAELVAEHDAGWQIAHGDVDQAVAVLRQIAGLAAGEREARGRRAQAAVAAALGKARLCGAFCDAVERALGAGRRGEPPPVSP